MAHPDLTHRAAILTVLKSLIKAHTGKEIEFQVVPEVESIETPSNQVQGPYDDNDTLKSFFNVAFSETSDINIGYLTRYTFVPSQPIGDITKTHLQSILYKQKLFHKNI